MECDRCHQEMDRGDAREIHGEMLCEDCAMDALSPAKTCDPWAIYSAKQLEAHGGGGDLTEIQKKILRVLEETGGIEPALLAERLRVDTRELEREIAPLRHMEKLRGEIRGKKRVLCLWNAPRGG